MLKRIFSHQTNSVTTAAILVAFSSLFSRFLGVVRDRILAGQFGAGDTLDVYYAAFRVPDLVFNLLVLGALSAGFIPLFTDLLKDENDTRKNNEAWLLASNIINILALGLIAISTICIIFARPLAEAFAPGFSPEKLDQTVNLTRIMFLSPFFLGLSGVIGGVLQSFKRFLVYSFAPIMYNLGIIAGAVWLVPIWGTYGLAWGVVIGAFLHFAIQLPTAIQLGFKYRPRLGWKEPSVRKLGRLMVPRTMSLAISQVDLLVSTAIASTLASGSLTVFNLANNIQSFPIGIFGISFATAVFPLLSSKAKDRKGLVEIFSNTQRQILFFIIPSTMLVWVLRAQIVRVLYGWGQFNWEDTVFTIEALTFFSFSLFAQASIPLLVRMFYARQNSKHPFYIGITSVLMDIILSLWLSRTLGVAGIALAFSIANVFNYLMLWTILSRQLDGLDGRKILLSSSKFVAAGLTAMLVAQYVKIILLPFIDMQTGLGVFTQGFTAGMIGLLVYAGTCAILKSEELDSFWQGLKRRLPWKQLESEDQGEARGI
ncbi:murein biosynthesis integral membrane protein MurJ [Candidatus Falkowbacteria bacterium]|nr:murein biosynthesis integral membrane protein MurJ [Candidatus Falkowbacteria bacterium]